MYSHNRIYKILLESLERGAQTRADLLEDATIKLTGVEFSPPGQVGKYTEIRATVGEIINEMEEKGVIVRTGELYNIASSRPIALRAENCEKQILAILRDGPKTKVAIRKVLESYFGTDKTATLRDDNTLYSLNGQVLKRLQKLGLIKLDNGLYYIAPEKMASINDIDAILSLKVDFLTRIHSKGGEFFEHFIMTLLGKYLAKHGKTVLENKTNGGACDGGIDGIMKTVDPLGFRETIMVQAKNRHELTTETVARGFYGAVCAYQGSRGIFATTSDFHPSAKAFLDSIDNCVGVNGDMIFKMAIECQYGFKRRGGKYVIDTKIL